MFSFFKKKKPVMDTPGNYGVLTNDMHSHLLPGIDDGAPDVATSLQLIDGLMALGYKKFICTPHVMADLYPNNTTTIQVAEEKLKKALIEKGIDVPIHAAAEYFMDDSFNEMLRNKEPMLTIKDNLVLVEFSFASPPIDYKGPIFNLQMNGYKPILAHPERYNYFHQTMEKYEELRDAGCLFQINILSLMGYYGKSVAKTAEALVKKGYIELLGTDLHHERHLNSLGHPQLIQRVHEIAATHTLLNNTL